MTSGAGAAALACLGLLVKLGIPARKHLGDRPGRRGVRGPHRADGRGQGQFAQRPICAPWSEVIAGPTCSWACRPVACSSKDMVARWPRAR